MQANENMLAKYLSFIILLISCYIWHLIGSQIMAGYLVVNFTSNMWRGLIFITMKGFIYFECLWCPYCNRVWDWHRHKFVWLFVQFITINGYDVSWEYIEPNVYINGLKLNCASYLALNIVTIIFFVKNIMCGYIDIKLTANSGKNRYYI